MHHIVSLLFIIEFILIVLICFFLLFKEGVSFKVGISFAVLYFIFIPVFVMIFTGTLPLSLADFGATDLNHIVLQNNIKNSFILLAFIFSIILYLYFPLLKHKNSSQFTFNPTLKIYILIYIIGMSFIFIGSGLFKGGNWYDNRHDFFESFGAVALLLAFILNSSKILIIGSLFYKWLNNQISFIKFIVFVSVFTIIDMFLSGNRIYLFCTFSLIGLIILKKYTKKTLLYTPVIVPSIFMFGYFASIFKHMRGPLFYYGFPSFQIFLDALKRAINLEPPNPMLFFLGISESVNVNVVYKLLGNFDNYLYGTTFLKPLFFYLPRSIWASKPETITIIAAKEYGGASLVTTIIGEMFMNFYLYGLILLPIFLWFIDNILSFALKKYGDLSKILMFLFGILIFRMPFSDEFLVFVFLLLILEFGNFFQNIKFVIKKE
jgi:hypothetical protein